MKELLIKNSNTAFNRKYFLLATLIILVAVGCFKFSYTNTSATEIPVTVQPRIPPRIRYVGYLRHAKLIKAIVIINNKFFEIDRGSSVNHIQFEIITPTYLVVRYNDSKFTLVNEFAR